MRSNKKAIDRKADKFRTSYGFIAACAGSAVGLGNIWGFPSKLGRGGGFSFLILYILCLALAGIPLLTAELSIGKQYGASPPAAFRAIHPRLGLIGLMQVLACFITLCYYCYFGGKLLEYTAAAVGLKLSGPLLWDIIFTLVTGIIVFLGVQAGIERCSRILMPVLVIILAGLCVFSFSLDGSREALAFMFKPDFTFFNADTFSSALTQLLFSLSVGYGCMITFGAYGAKNSMLKPAIAIAAADTIVAVLAALFIIPSAFVCRISPASGPTLLFDVVPLIFSRLTGSQFMIPVFFSMVFFAALTSSVSMMEVPAVMLMQETKLSRKSSINIIIILTILCSFPICISLRVFEAYEFISQYLLICISSVFTCIAAGWMMKKDYSTALGNAPSVVEKSLVILLCFVTPALLLIVPVSVLTGH